MAEVFDCGLGRGGVELEKCEREREGERERLVYLVGSPPRLRHG